MARVEGLDQADLRSCSSLSAVEPSVGVVGTRRAFLLGGSSLKGPSPGIRFFFFF